MNNMIIHSFFSDGLYDWAVLFLESFKYHHGDEEYKIVFKSLGLTNDQLIYLYDKYQNLDIINKDYDWGWIDSISTMMGFSRKRLIDMKDEIEHGSDKTRDYYKWKIMMSVEERYRKSIPEVIKLYKDSFRYLFHLDIDMYFNKRIDKIEKIIKSSDISFEFREDGVKSLNESTRIAGGIMGFDMHSNHTHALIESWCKFIDAISTINKPRDYGQTSLYYAYKYMKKGVKWGKFSLEREMSMWEDPSCIVWSGNRGSADVKLEQFWRCFKSLTKNGHILSARNCRHDDIIEEEHVLKQKKHLIREQKRFNKEVKKRFSKDKSERKIVKSVSGYSVEECNLYSNYNKNSKENLKIHDDTIIHSFFTDGLFKWSKLFLKSFKYNNDVKYPIVFSTIDLNPSDEIDLYMNYSNINFINKKMKWNMISRETGIHKNELVKMKKEIEYGRVTVDNYKWKVYISVMERYKKSIIEVMKSYDFKYLLHFDIDTYIRGNIQPLADFIKNYDVSLRFRNNIEVKGKVCGNLLGFTINEKSLKFMDRWIEIINSMDFKDMPKGYGQISLYQAYEDMKNEVNFGNIDDIVSISRNFNEKSCIWEGNNGEKDESLNVFFDDFKRKYKEK